MTLNILGLASFYSNRNHRNVLWSAIDFAVFPAAMLVATPVLVYNLGIEQFGVYILMNSFVGFSLVFNFGFGDTILKYVSHYNTRGRKQRSAQIVRLVGMLALWTGLIVGVLLILASSVIAKVFNIDGLAYAKPALHLVAVIAPLKMLESGYVGTLRGVYRYDLCGPVTTTTKILTVGSHAGLAILNYQLPVLLAVSAVLSGISTLVLFGISCRMLGNLTPRFSMRLFNKIKGFSAWSWVQGIAGILYISLDRLVIAAFLGPSVLGVYGVCVQISQNAHNAFAALSHTLFPRISSINSRRPLEAGGSNELHDVYVEASRRITVFSILVGSMVAIFSYQILHVWMGAAIAEKGYMLLSLLAVASSWYTSNQTMTSYTLNGLGLPRLQASVSALSTIILSLCCFVLVSLFGVTGAAVARFVDIPVRIVARIHLGRSIIGGVRPLASFDFLVLSMTALGVGLLFKKVFHLSGDIFLYGAPFWTVLLLIAFVFLLYKALYKIDCHIMKSSATE
jgi:O-antigen/teichoic acid export membrane protein